VIESMSGTPKYLILPIVTFNIFIKIYILIVTNKEGKISVNYNAYYSWKKMAKQLNTLSSGDYAKWQYELAMLNSGKHDTINPDDYTKVFGNYQDIDLYQE